MTHVSIIRLAPPEFSCSCGWQADAATIAEMWQQHRQHFTRVGASA